MLESNSICTTDEANTPNIELREPRGSILPHLGLVVVQLIALNLSRSRTERLIGASVVIGFAISAQNNRFTNDIANANLFALAWPHYLSTIEKLLFSRPNGPSGDFWRVRGKKGEALDWKAFSWAKLRWAGSLMTNLRGVGWNFQISPIPTMSSAYRSRLRFLFWKSIEFCLMLVMADVISQSMVALVFSPVGRRTQVVNSKCITLRDPDWKISFLKTLVYGAGPYYFINMQYLFCSLVAVGLGISSQEDWPPLFGKLHEVTTVRKFWGRFWQQMIRRSFNTYTRKVTSWLGFERGTLGSKYGQLYLAFFMSGCFHAASILLMPSPTNITFRERTVGIMQYFVWQAVAITIEDLVQWLWERGVGSPVGESRSLAFVGYVWVICSFWFSLPFAGDVMMRIKMGETSPLPFTIARPMVQRLLSALPKSR